MIMILRAKACGSFSFSSSSSSSFSFFHSHSPLSAVLGLFRLEFGTFSLISIGPFNQKQSLIE